MRTIFSVLYFLFLFSNLTIAQENVSGFYVSDRFIYDKCDEKFIIRGVNKMFIWNDPQGNTIPEIAKTGANAIRIVWLAHAPDEINSLESLEKIFKKCIDYGIVPIPECHDATCENWSNLTTIIDWWTKNEVVDLIKKYEDYLILNIANEPGKNTDSKEWYNAYKEAVLQMRKAGIKVPLIIDTDQCGQNIDRIQEYGSKLTEMDPLHNLIFSAHVYWTGREYSKQIINDEIDECAALNFPIIIGEFAQQAWDGSPLDFKTLLHKCDENEIGWIAWSWGPGNENTELDMTKNGQFITLHEWGLNVAVSNSYGLLNSSERSYFIENNTCEIDDPKVGISNRLNQIKTGVEYKINVEHKNATNKALVFSVFNKDTVLFLDEYKINSEQKKSSRVFAFTLPDSTIPGFYNIETYILDEKKDFLAKDSLLVSVTNELKMGNISLSLVSPKTDNEILESDNVYFSVNCSDQDKQINEITYFLSGDSMVFSDTYPFDAYYYNIRRGRYTFYARATDYNHRQYFSDTIKFVVGKKIEAKNELEMLDYQAYIDSVKAVYPLEIFYSAEQDAEIVYGLFNKNSESFGGGKYAVKKGNRGKLDLDIEITKNPTPGETHFWRFQLIPKDSVVRVTASNDVQVKIPFKEFYFNPNSKNIIAYSNPGSNRLVIRNTAPNIEMNNLQIMNLYGEIITNQNIHERQDIFVLNLNTIPDDKYIILIDTNKGIIQKNIVKEEEKHKR